MKPAKEMKEERKEEELEYFEKPFAKTAKPEPVDYFEIEDIEESSHVKPAFLIEEAKNNNDLERDDDSDDEDYDRYLAKLEQVSDDD